jgi:predicted nuclease with RNAse H fold
MSRSTVVWCGVDVGGPRKGFHLAAVDTTELLGAPRTGFDVAGAVEWIAEFSPAVTAVDSPICAAPKGCPSRAAERLVPREVGCNIRATPEPEVFLARPDDLYGWIIHGFQLYNALRDSGIEALECFPTASRTRWAGLRGKQTRAAWTRQALAATGLANLPLRTNQDQRDAIAAALTARAHSHGVTESFGEIVVPLSPAEAVG